MIFPNTDCDEKDHDSVKNGHKNHGIKKKCRIRTKYHKRPDSDGPNCPQKKVAK